MTDAAHVALLLLLLAEPLLALAVEARRRLRARGGAAGGAARTAAGPGAGGTRAARGAVTGTHRGAADLTVVVPVTDPHDLRRLAWLRGQGERVLLVTSAAHPAALLRAVWRAAREDGFRVHVVGAGTRPVPGGRPPGRTRLVADAHAVIRSAHVVCVDPGTVVACPLEHVVDAVARAGLDVATLPATTEGGGVLARLQRVDEALAQRLRGRAPWTGGVHVARRTVHAELLARHTAFGPGDDAELEVLATARRHRVGRVAVPVRAPAPPGLRAWLAAQVRQAAGVVRVAVLHVHLGLRHPSLHLLEAAASCALVPLLWWSAVRVPWALVPVAVVHAAAALVLTRDPVALLHPVVALGRVLVLLPAGAVAYVVAAVRAGDPGLLRPHDPWWAPGATDAAVLPRLPGPARATDFWARR